MTPQARLATREFFGIKLGLDTMRALCAALGDPQRTFFPVIVAGTNGKGSVSAMTAHALTRAGHRTGRYTSPHLVHLRERFAVDDVDASDAQLDAALAEVFAAEDALLTAGTIPAAATYFELTTAAAFALFRNAGVRVAVVEVGLGGRHDATNVVEASVAAITSIAFDHMAHLGDTLEAIASEKAGVIMPGATVVSGVTQPGPATVIADTCARQGARLVRADHEVQVEATTTKGETTLRLETPERAYGPLPLALRGSHQVGNAIVAVRLLEAMDAGGVAVPADAIVDGLSGARWPGRLERRQLPGNVPLILDGAHNPAGALALAAWLREAGLARVTLVTACMRDKDVEGLLRPLLPLAVRVVATAVAFPRALPADELAAQIARLAPGLPVEHRATPAEALGLASQYGDSVVVAGSLFLVGAVRGVLDEVAGQPDPA
ncbi:MAG TPA: folylpolyglutamate synthase/dihydrofolate synthase family protein [Luteitalea sp.]|nr:folylpolyglutamate synthase/dihydrofolate synthase family protein [Luteitalea sp.]